MKKILIPALMLALLIPARAQEIKMLVGTYTEGTEAEGVYLYAFNTENGAARLLDVALSGNPSFVIASPDGSLAYAVNEFNDGRQGMSSFVIDGDNIDPLNSIVMPDYLVDGRDPCNILLAGGRVISSNYTGGSASAYSLNADGSIADPLQFIGRESSHMHCAVLSPDGKYLFITDLGRDQVLRFETGAEPFGPSTIAWENADSFQYGPRHMVFSADGRFAYLLCELGDILVVFSYADGELTPIQTLRAYKGKGHGSADIHISPDGRFLYTSHRLRKDGISIFAIDPSSGLVKRKGFKRTGVHPRNFAISPDGRYLLCACRDSNRIDVYRRNPRNGSLRRCSRIEVGAPVCVQFISGK